MPDIEMILTRQMMQQMGNDEDERARPKLSPPFEAQDLRDGLTALNTVHQFEPGMIVRQKKSCRAYRDFGANGMAVVISVLEIGTLFETADSGSPAYRMPLDLVIGQRAPDGDFVVHHVDRRRYEPVPSAELEFTVRQHEYTPQKCSDRV